MDEENDDVIKQINYVLMAARCGEGGNNDNDKYANYNNKLIIWR